MIILHEFCFYILSWYSKIISGGIRGWNPNFFKTFFVKMPNKRAMLQHEVVSHFPMLAIVYKATISIFFIAYFLSGKRRNILYFNVWNEQRNASIVNRYFVVFCSSFYYIFHNNEAISFIDITPNSYLILFLFWCYYFFLLLLVI